MGDVESKRCRYVLVGVEAKIDIGSVGNDDTPVLQGGDMLGDEKQRLFCLIAGE